MFSRSYACELSWIFTLRIKELDITDMNCQCLPFLVILLSLHIIHRYYSNFVNFLCPFDASCFRYRMLNCNMKHEEIVIAKNRKNGLQKCRRNGLHPNFCLTSFSKKNSNKKCNVSNVMGQEEKPSVLHGYTLRVIDQWKLHRIPEVFPFVVAVPPPPINVIPVWNSMRNWHLWCCNATNRTTLKFQMVFDISTRASTASLIYWGIHSCKCSNTFTHKIKY